MKLNIKLSYMMLGAAAIVTACDDIDDQLPQGGRYTAEQVKETNGAIPARAEATFNGMFTMMGRPGATYASNRADDFGYISAAISQDMEAADLVGQNSGYNWFSAAAEMTSRTANYANPYMRYKLPYNQIGVANEIMANQEEGSNFWAQAKAMRAFAYSQLAPYFAFGYTIDKSAPCIPLLTDGVDYTNNPRATVEEVYNAILADLNDAIEALKQNPTERGTDKSKIDINVALGLRARTYLSMGEWAKAAADAAEAIKDYAPASLSEVSHPAFCSMSEHNWMWAIDITDDMLLGDAGGYPTSSSWLSAFSGDGYGAATGCYACINTLLYDKISASDVRKGWWVDANLNSPLLEGLSWGPAQGQAIATYAYDDKVEFLPYTNVKFGMNSGIGSTTNNNDWPLMRVEEMILIQAEGLAKSGNESQARQVLTDFIKVNRDPNYSVDDRSLTLADEIWFQRRVELWGEGFATFDLKRLGKPMVRFHEGKDNNWPDAYRFNMAANDGWLNMRFSQRETDNNKGIVDNKDGNLPVSGQNGQLRDGVTD